MSKYDEASAKYIGSGGFGRVESIVRSWDQKTVARKIVHADQKTMRSVINEYRIQRYLDHPNIARYIDVEWCHGEAKFYMELFKDGSLDKLIDTSDKPGNGIPTEDVWAIFYQLSAAIAYCHDPKKNLRDVEDEENDDFTMRPTIVYHRDIKPHNVLKSSEAKNSLEALKLSDFGLSFILEGSRNPGTYAGTQEYKPPEISLGREEGIEWTTKCDVYSLGCTLYEICNGHPPFKHSPENASDAAKFPSIRDFYDDEDLRDYITNCLSFDKDRRREAAEIHKKAKEKLKESKYKSALQYELLLEAVEEGSLERVESCLREYKVTNSMDGKRYTPLHRAVQYRRVNVVKKLLDEGFSALAETEDYETPLHIAMESMMESKYKILQLQSKISKLRNGTLKVMNQSSNPKNQGLESKFVRLTVSKLKTETQESTEEASGSTITELESKIMTLKAENEYMSWLLVDSCRNTKTDIFHKFYPRGWTLLHLAVAANNVQIVEDVLRDYPDWDYPTKGKKWSLVHIAARNGHVELLALLLERKKGNQKATIEQISSDEATPLFAASKHGQTDAVSLLLRKGANVNVRTRIKIRLNETRDGMTALHIAALGGHAKTVEILLRDPNTSIIGAKTNHSETALHLAVQNNHKSCIDVIMALKPHVDIEAKAKFNVNGTTQEKWTALHMAIENDNFAGTHKLLELDANPESQTEDGDTALHLAARKGFKAIVTELLSKKAKADKINRRKASPLHEAIRNSMTETPEGQNKAIEAMGETAKILIDHDKNLVAQETRIGETALHLAAKVGNLAIFKAAYERNPGLVNKQTHDGETALHVAARADHFRIVRFLLKEGTTDQGAKNDRGETPLRVATGRSEAELENYGQ